jgi:hypothetical protein
VSDNSIRYAEPSERAAIGVRIDPATAAVWFISAIMFDPYLDLDLPDDEARDGLGREWFAADPDERVAVHFYDLDPSKREALEDKRRAADREGWERIFRDVTR